MQLDGGRCAESGGCARAPVQWSRRTLSLRDGVATVDFQESVGPCAFGRTALVSAADGVFALRLNASAGCRFNVMIQVEREGGKGGNRPVYATAGADANALLLRASLGGGNGGGGGGGVVFAAQAQLAHLEPPSAVVVVADVTSGVGLRATGLTSATLLVSAASDFAQRVGDRAGDGAGAGGERAEPPSSACAHAVRVASTRPWIELLERHVAAHRRVFGGFGLRLEGVRRVKLSTPRRLAASREDWRRRGAAEDIGLVEQLVQLGRYLLLASSSPASALPANLQGVWADGLRPPWGADFHLNINLQMAYWQAGPTDLLPAITPLAPFLRRLAASGARVARGFYGSSVDGAWLAYGFTDGWASAAPLAPPAWSFCLSCGAWAALALWETYRFSQSAADLAGACRFQPVDQRSSATLPSSLPPSTASPHHHTLIRVRAPRTYSLPNAQRAAQKRMCSCEGRHCSLRRGYSRTALEVSVRSRPPDHCSGAPPTHPKTRGVPRMGRHASSPSMSRSTSA